MKFLFFAPRYHTNQHFIVKALLDNGHKVKFAVLYRGQSEEYSVLQPTVIGFSSFFKLIDRIFNRRKDLLFRAIFGLPKIGRLFVIMRSFDPDVVIVRSPKYITFWIIICLCKVFDKKFIVYTQGAKYRSCISKKVLIFRYLLLDLLGGAWVTPVERKKRSDYITHRYLYYMPFVYDVEDYSMKRSYFDDGKVRILSIGKYVPRKNHLLLLEAIHKLKTVSQFKIKVTLLGECSSHEHRRQLRKVQEYIASKGLSDIVTVRCNLPCSDVQSEYCKHDIFVLPSSAEPAAYSILEAMAHGLPVVCSDSNGTKGYIKYGRTGYVFKSDSVSDLSDKLSILLNCREHIVECGRNGFEVVKREHSPEKYHSALMAMIKNGFSHSEPLPRV